MRRSFILIRVITAAVLFLLLAQANTWADTNTHLVIAVGYRAFLLASPAFLLLGVSNAMRLSLIICVLSLVLSFFHFGMLAAGLFALAMAVSGYISKFINSSTSRGAADNKVSLNVGSLLAGGLVILISDKNILLTISLVAIIFTVYLAFSINWKEIVTVEAKPAATKKIDFNYLKCMGWSLIGIATGVKLTGIFVILPQYLLHTNASLPAWYGGMIALNSLGVIFIQHKMLRVLESKKPHFTHLAALSSLLLLALPTLFYVEYLGMAVLWIALLTLGECALSLYDKIAKDQGYLFYKELMVGVGSFVTVLLSRNLGEHIYLSGLVGALAFVTGLGLVMLPHRWSIKAARYVSSN